MKKKKKEIQTGPAKRTFNSLLGNINVSLIEFYDEISKAESKQTRNQRATETGVRFVSHTRVSVS